MSLRIIAHVVPYLCSIMHMHFYCYLTGGSAYLLDRGKEWCNGEQGSNLRIIFAFPLEKLAKNLLVRTNFNFSDFECQNGIDQRI